MTEPQHTQDFPPQKDEQNNLPENGNYLPENGNCLPEQPLSKKEFATQFGYNPDVVSKGLKTLKELFESEDLFVGEKLSVFAQEQFLKLKKYGKNKYKENVLFENQKSEQQPGELVKMEDNYLPDFYNTEETIIDVTDIDPTVLVEHFSNSAKEESNQINTDQQDCSTLEENIKKLNQMEEKIIEQKVQLKGKSEYWKQKKLEKEAFMKEKQKDLSQQVLGNESKE